MKTSKRKAKICSRGHAYSGGGPCPVCWPGYYQKKAKRLSADCPWPGGDKLMIAYHDKEWGVPARSDKKLFEFLVLESAQAGLSWRTVLHKREGYRKAFAGFDPKRVAQFTQRDVERLLKNPEIIRNRQKIIAAIRNAGRFLEVRKEFGTFSNYMWSFVGGVPVDGKRKRASQLPATTAQARRFADDLKKRGFRFLGPTVVYAHMQAVGMVNDHLVSCSRYKKIKSAMRMR